MCLRASLSIQSVLYNKRATNFQGAVDFAEAAKVKVMIVTLPRTLKFDSQIETPPGLQFIIDS